MKIKEILPHWKYCAVNTVNFVEGPDWRYTNVIRRNEIKTKKETHLGLLRRDGLTFVEVPHWSYSR